VFFESKIDVALFTVLIALLVLNGRVAASVSSIVTRGFYALVATYHIKESLTPLIENISENCYIRGLKINSVDSLAVKNVTLMVGENVLLRNIDMEFKQGKTYGIYGAVGTGKSTLVKALFNLHEEYTGNISYNGIYEAKTIDRHCFADHVCYLDIHSDFLKGSIFHNFYIRGVRDKARIVSLCRAIFHTMAVDYEFVFKTDVTMIPMSSGQKRKLMLYMSISHEKSLIVLDEALVNLSIDDVVAARNYIAEVCPQAIVVIVSHDRSILNLLPNVYQIEAGAVKTLKSDVVKIGQK
jgi:ABC-type bacteriocin/lantibiotic exporter with double-glycine peptidase domain